MLVDIPDDILMDGDYLGHKFSQLEAYVDLLFLKQQEIELSVRKMALRWRWEQTKVFRFLKSSATLLQQQRNTSVCENQDITQESATEVQHFCNNLLHSTEKEKNSLNNNNNKPLKKEKEDEKINQNKFDLQKIEDSVVEQTFFDTTPTPPKKTKAQLQAEQYEKKVASGTNIPPTIEQIQDYLAKRGFTDVDAEYFWNYHTARGWYLTNGRVMKNWHGAIATWRKNNFNGRSNNNTGISGKAAANQAAADSFAQSQREFLDGKLPF